MIYITLACRCLIGMVFAASAIGKLRSRKALLSFASWTSELPLPVVSRHPLICAAGLAATEATLVILIVLPWTVTVGMAASSAALAVLTVGVFAVARLDNRVLCRCFGASAAPLGMRHAARNSALFLVAVAGVIYTGSGEIQPFGATICIFVAVAVALLVIFLDDVTNLITGTGAWPDGPGHES